MKKEKNAVLSTSLLGFTLLLSACTAVYPPSGFLGDYSRLAKGKHFRQEYVAPEVDFSKFKKVKVEPAELKHFNDPLNQISEADRQKLAARLKSSLEAELAKKYQVLDLGGNPDKETLVVSPALIYIGVPKRLLNLATFYFIGFSFSKGSAAFEAKLTDGGTGKEIVEAAEKRNSGGGIRDIKSILLGGWIRFTCAEGAFKRWGRNFLNLTEVGAGR